MGKVALSPTGSPLRRDTFIDDTLNPQIGRFVRRVGRPRLDWTTCVLKEGRRLLGNERLTELLSNCDDNAVIVWNQAIHNIMSRQVLS